ncbi:MAG: DUF1348 family protein [Nostoc sp.]|uniref:DUF1348 family protein n=1 Tax=Nostoc sp. TaxID=1180 RepID=UPI002FF4A8CA
MNNPENPRLPLPPFDNESAIQKVRIAEDAWNTRNAELVSCCTFNLHKMEIGEILNQFPCQQKVFSHQVN